jgi:hypothetical protein
MMNQVIEAGHVGSLDPFSASPNAPAPPKQPPFRHFTILGPVPENVARDGIGQGTVVMLDCDIRESCAINGKDSEEPVMIMPGPATATSVYASRSIYNMVLERLGTVASDAPRTDRWRDAGETWATECMLSAPRDAFEEFTGTRAAFLSMVKDRLLNSFLLPVETADEIIGEPSELPAKTLWVGQDADRLAEAERLRDEQMKAAEAAAAIVHVDVARPKTVAELGASIVSVQRDRPAKVDLSPWAGAALLWSTNEELFYGYRTPLALPLPVYTSDTFRVLATGASVPTSVVALPEISPAGLAWTRWMIAKHATDTYLGPIDSARWSDSGLARAKEICAEHAPTFLNARLAYLWGHLCEVLIRGLLVYPPQAELFIRSAVREEEIRRSPPLMVPVNAPGGGFGAREVATIAPSSPVPSDPMIAGLCIEAARCGSVSAGCLLEPSTFESKSLVKKARK